MLGGRLRAFSGWLPRKGRPETHRASAFPRAPGSRAPALPTPYRGRRGVGCRSLPRRIDVAIRLSSSYRHGGDRVAAESAVRAKLQGTAVEGASDLGCDDGLLVSVRHFRDGEGGLVCLVGPVAPCPDLFVTMVRVSFVRRHGIHGEGAEQRLRIMGVGG